MCSFITHTTRNYASCAAMILDEQGALLATPGYVAGLVADL